MLKTVVKTSVSRTAFAEMLSSDIFQMVYHPLPRARRSHTIGADVEKNSLKEEGFESDWKRWKRRDWRRQSPPKKSDLNYHLCCHLIFHFQCYSTFFYSRSDLFGLTNERTNEPLQVSAGGQALQYATPSPRGKRQAGAARWGGSV